MKAQTLTCKAFNMAVPSIFICSIACGKKFAMLNTFFPKFYTLFCVYGMSVVRSAKLLIAGSLGICVAGK